MARIHSGCLLIHTDPQVSVISWQESPCHYTPFGHCQKSYFHSNYAGQLRERPAAAYLMGNGQRNYSPALMRFWTADPLGPFMTGDLNSYAYCAADPVNKVDISGLSGISSVFKGLRNSTGRRINSTRLSQIHKTLNIDKEILKQHLVQSGVPKNYRETARKYMEKLQDAKYFKKTDLIFSRFDPNASLPHYSPNLDLINSFKLGQAQVRHDTLALTQRRIVEKLSSRNKMHLIDAAMTGHSTPAGRYSGSAYLSTPPDYAQFAPPTYAEALRRLRYD